MPPTGRLIERPYPSSLSLVIPLYNEQAVLPLLKKKLVEIAPTLKCPLEIILVDDGSLDQTLSLATEWAERDPRIGVLALSRNFGHQAASTAGLDAASGEAIVLLDADLQDPPELIHEMIAQYQRGFEVVYAQREAREGESVWKRLEAWIFYRVMRLIAFRDLPADTGDFRLISAECLRTLQRMRETHRFLRGMVAWVGYPQTAVRFRRPPRAAGEPKYSTWMLSRLAWTGLISFSANPLRIAFGLSLLAALAGVCVVIYALTAIALGWFIPRGWTSLMLMLCFIGSSILVSVGMVGEYIARLFESSKDRPIYILQERATIRPAGFTGREHRAATASGPSNRESGILPS